MHWWDFTGIGVKFDYGDNTSVLHPLKASGCCVWMCIFSRDSPKHTHTGTAFDTITVVPCDQTDTKLSLSLVSLCRYVSHKATTYCISIFVVDKPAKSLFNNGWHVRTHTEWHKRLKKGISRNETFANRENIKALKCCSKSEQLLPCHN